MLNSLVGASTQVFDDLWGVATGTMNGIGNATTAVIDDLWNGFFG